MRVMTVDIENKSTCDKTEKEVNEITLRMGKQGTANPTLSRLVLSVFNNKLCPDSFFQFSITILFVFI
jgi:hypothetical protein